jgi:hypothetical protein
VNDTAKAMGCICVKIVRLVFQVLKMMPLGMDVNPQLIFYQYFSSESIGKPSILPHR